MSKFWTILKAEYAQVVKKKSFIIGIILTPAFMILITVIPALLAGRGISTPARYAVIDADGRGIGRDFANALEKYTLDSDTTTKAYHLMHLYEVAADDTERLDSLRTALDSMLLTKKLKNYVVIYPGVDENDSALIVSKSLNFKTVARFDRSMSNILAAMRLEKSNINMAVDSVLAMTRRIDMQHQSPGGKTRDFLSVYFGALIFVMIIFISVISFGQILMRSIIEEKNSRVIEVLISSVSPFQLMMGKVIGLGAANMTQIGIWVLIGMALFSFRGPLNIPRQVADIMFNPVLIVFFVLFLLVAYIMYSTMFAFVGSICTTDKETQNFVLPITMSLILPVMLLMYIVQEPDSTVTIVMSLIPVLTPTMMVARLIISAPETFSLSNPIVLEATLGFVIAALFSLALIWLTARIFRVGILMYGKRATLPEIMKWVRHR
jgi:ABC-2 type transport system permease protein